MGNRILKERILTSPEITELSWFEEALFYRLIVAVDDYGTYYADPVLLTRTLFPTKEKVTRAMTGKALEHLEALGLIRRWRADGKVEYLQLCSWRKHQRLRNSRRKFPSPEGELPEETPAEAEPEGIPEEPARTEPEAAAVVTLPLRDGREYPVTQADAEEFAALYPGLDIPRELRSMRAWCLTNEEKRKPLSDIRRFMNSWLARAQERGSAPEAPAKPQAPDNPFLAMFCEGDVS